MGSEEKRVVVVPAAGAAALGTGVIAASGGFEYEAYSPDQHPPFPEPGSVLAGRYFTLGRLGRGTFCSIHKCIDLTYSHKDSPAQNDRVVAAKVELSTFSNSGVLDGEATVLQHLSKTMPPQMIPKFFEYVRTTTLPTNTAPTAQGPSSSNNSNNPLQQPTATPNALAGPATPNPNAGSQTGGSMSAILMEYLPGEDMHHLRDRHCQSLSTSSTQTRRVSTKDAVYLTADVMLPLLKAMHQAGVVHRDVKPSNCVRTGVTDDDRHFKMVDFGLSKSFVVPQQSSYADTEHEWKGDWDRPPGWNASTGGKGCLRKERPDADFRGTSMYASLRVHQGRDYCRRDDLWGLLYVFCDLVTGGLPWMAHAANRDRHMCQLIKEMVQGERALDDWESTKTTPKSKAPFPDQMELLLYGADYHLAKHRRDAVKKATTDKGQDDATDSKLPPLPKPLAMSKDPFKVQLLRTVFQHLSNLSFMDEPNYDLIQKSIRGFLNTPPSRDRVQERAEADEQVRLIDWVNSPDERIRKNDSTNSLNSRKRMSSSQKLSDFSEEEDERPIWDLVSEQDPLQRSTLVDAERERASQGREGGDAGGGATFSADGEGGATSSSGAGASSMSPDAADISRLPLELQLRLAQAEFNAQSPTTIEPHLALRDWMGLALSLTFDPWDTNRYERGNHRTFTDGYRKEVYTKLLKKCLSCARAFSFFRSRLCFYYPPDPEDIERMDEAEEGEEVEIRPLKLRKIATTQSSLVSGDTTEDGGSNRTCRIIFSKVMHLLRFYLEAEQEKKFAPPPAISFGSGGDA